MKKRKTDFLRGGALALATMFLFATVVVQPVQAQNILKAVVCGSVKVVAGASNLALDLSVAAMNAAFKLQIGLLEAAWKVQDQAVTLIREVSQSAFTGLLAVYAAVTAWTSKEKAAVAKYKTTILNALEVVHNKIDAARAAYREDMMALVKAHQKALANIANIAVTTIKNAFKTALQDCGKKVGVVAKLVATIAAAQLKHVAQSVAQEVKDLLKAVKLVSVRNSAFFKADVEYVKVSLKATGDLLKATLGWRKESQEAQRVIDEQESDLSTRTPQPAQ